jgi:hypothetical protein
LRRVRQVDVVAAADIGYVGRRARRCNGALAVVALTYSHVGRTRDLPHCDCGHKNLT